MKAKRRRRTIRRRQPSYGRALLVAGLVVAFLVGTLVSGYILPGSIRAEDPAETLAVQPAVYRTAVPVRPAAYQQPRVYDYGAVPQQQRGRSWEREVLIVAGSAGAGAAIGGVAGGKKGAAIGAMSGGVAGLVYDLATRNRTRQPR
jgi:hypothetical protein